MSSKVDYNLEPVFFCTNCYSLCIKHDDFVDVDYCGKCGCSDIDSTSIYEWEKLYENRYRKKHITICEDPNRIKVNNMSFKELKAFVWKSPEWRHIIYALYPNFSRKLSRVDSIMLFFDLIAKDCRLRDLREVLVRYV